MRQFSPENQESTSPDSSEHNDQESHSHASGEDSRYRIDEHGVKRRRKKIKIRKRIRIRKKPSAKKKIKKISEIALWVTIVAGFILTLIILIKELDIKDEKFKQLQKSRKTQKR